MDASDALATRGLSFAFGASKPKTLKDLTFNVPTGRITAFLGPNGAGKTTTIKCLLGLLSPTGEIRIFDEDDPVRQRQHIGAMVESPAFYPQLSALNNLEIFARHGNRMTSRDGLSTLLEKVGLIDRAHDPVGSYSMGMKQRLGIARALIGSPKLLILDEPTNGLDPRGMHGVRQLILDLQKEEQLSVLISTHLLAEAELPCDWLVVIDNGEIRACDSFERLSGQQNRFRVKHTDRQALEQALFQIEEVVSHEPDDGGFLVELSSGDGTSLNQALCAQHIFVSALIPERSSLEQLFLNLTEADT